MDNKILKRNWFLSDKSKLQLGKVIDAIKADHDLNPSAGGEHKRQQ